VTGSVTHGGVVQLTEGYTGTGAQYLAMALSSPLSVTNISRSSTGLILNPAGTLALSGTIGNVAGTATMGLTLKTGSGSGNYTGTNTILAAVDTTNLCYSLTIPTGWKLAIQADGVLESVTAAVAQSVALADAGTSCTSGGVTALAGTERDITPAAVATFDVGFSTGYVFTGDGNAHSIVLLAKTSNAADAWGVQNASAASAPHMTFTLLPSN